MSDKTTYECSNCSTAMEQFDQGTKTYAGAWADAYFKFKCPSCGAIGSVEEQNRRGKILRKDKGDLIYNGAA